MNDPGVQNSVILAGAHISGVMGWSLIRLVYAQARLAVVGDRTVEVAGLYIHHIRIRSLKILLGTYLRRVPKFFNFRLNA